MRIARLGVSGCWRCMVVAGRTIGSHSQYYSIVSRFLPTCILQQAGKYITIILAVGGHWIIYTHLSFLTKFRFV